MNRYTGKAWDEHFLPRLSRKQIAELDKENALVVLPVAAIEQHGPHLPTYTDTLINETMLTCAFEALPEGAPVWLIPPLAYGKSTEHLGIPGTLTLSATTLMAVLLDIAKSLRASGFRKLAFYNTHGGNIDLLNMMAREIRIETGLAVFQVQFDKEADPEVVRREPLIDIHGGDVETSLILASREHWVDMSEAPDEIPNLPASPTLQFKNKAFAWVMDDLSESGICGNAKLASVALGRHLYERGGKAMAAALMELVSFDMAGLRKKGH
ncbi:creatininase family protein [Paenibacillus arenilitoris]|uniref:Creatininase family protein n=1 Tax=Paenibacillus arenilitoris TaxID=2772299 RepID=A0A927CN58_9BACL|nr:creatininase family protein [Paenibacillus arenilitoris]MBD2868660.1 creatininase family protein [Paenibacillus arenilitoris]